LVYYFATHEVQRRDKLTGSVDNASIIRPYEESINEAYREEDRDLELQRLLSSCQRKENIGSVMSHQEDYSDSIVVRNVTLERQAESQEVVEEVLPEFHVVSFLDQLVNDFLKETTQLDKVVLFHPRQIRRSRVRVAFKSIPAALLSKEHSRHDRIESNKGEASKEGVVKNVKDPLGDTFRSVDPLYVLVLVFNVRKYFKPDLVFPVGFYNVPNTGCKDRKPKFSECTMWNSLTVKLLVEIED
jgi:hypothetical protein